MKTILPPKGMRDFLPREKEIRERVMDIILDEYEKSGFNQIETSMIENLENLTNSNSGENTKLIYKILKRGEKFKPTENSREDDLSDLALRFDLTLPLSRYYANNRNELPTVFKSLQTGYSFRAERPGKGRYRAFKQCDVDIIGDETNIAEIELLSTVYKTFDRIGLKGQVIKINDRRFLKELITSAGFAVESCEDVAISLDKLDKIGEEGVKKELLKKDYAENHIDNLLAKLFEIKEAGFSVVEEIDKASYDNLNKIITVLKKTYPDLKLEFDPTLVRGMGYYTGTIYEIFYGDAKGAIGGGGRYDNMIERLSGTSAPACGISIGYERLLAIVLENDLVKLDTKNIALFYEDKDDFVEVLKLADTLRKDYDKVSTILKKKKFGKQIARLKAEGFDYFVSYDEDKVEIKES